MDQHRFVVTKSLTHLPSRRDVLRGLAGAGLALGLAELPDRAGARKKRRKKNAAQAGGKGRTRTVTRTYANTAAITLPIAQTSPVAGSPYPLPIAVNGLQGPIQDVNVRLVGLSHDFAQDVEVLLVGPGGQTAIVMAGVGGAFKATNVTLTLDDEAAAPLPLVGVASGAFRPTNAPGAPIAFKAPAPNAGANAALTVFDGDNPNGTWQLFVQDRVAANDPGVFAGGWEIEITTKVKARKKRR